MELGKTPPPGHQPVRESHGVRKAVSNFASSVSAKMSKMADGAKRAWDRQFNVIDVHVKHEGKLHIYCLTKAEAYRLHSGQDPSGMSYSKLREMSSNEQNLQAKLEVKVAQGTITHDSIKGAYGVKEKDVHSVSVVFKEIENRIIDENTRYQSGTIESAELSKREKKIVDDWMKLLPDEDNKEKLCKKMESSHDYRVQQLANYARTRIYKD